MNVGAIRTALRGVRRLSSRATLPLLEKGDGFAGSVAVLISEARRERIVDPNLDPWRFPGSVPCRYNPTEAHKILYFLHRREADLNRVAAYLADDQSRNLLRMLLAYRALGPSHVRLPRSDEAYMAYFASAASRRIGASRHIFPPFEVARYAVPFEGHVIEADAWLGNVIASYFERQYWFSRGNVSIRPEPGDVVIDAGACFGDTALAFAAAVGEGGSVHAFEPVPQQGLVLEENLARNPALAERIHVHKFATTDKSGERLMFVNGGAGAAINRAGTIPVQTLTIDDLVNSQRIARVDYIKMDIEGAETLALEGACETIRRFRPKLGISLYHSLDDIIDIPELIRRIEPSYRLYIDHHTIHAEETVLYAISV